MTSVAIVGAGAVGRSFGRGLCDAGWNIRAIVTRSKATAAAAVRAIGGGHAYDSLTRWVLEADAVLIATGEQMIPAVAGQLARMGGDEWRGKTVLHSGGATSSSVLAALAEQGAETGSIRPMQLFQRRGITELEGVLFVVEGSAGAVKKARRMALDVGGIAIEISSLKKRLCGAAAEIATTSILGLVAFASKLLTDAGFSQRQASQAALHLSRMALHNFARYGGTEAWKAASTRGDALATAEHARALSEYPPAFRYAFAAVEALGASIFERKAKAAGKG